MRLPIEVESPDADETPRKGEIPRRLVSRLAKDKAYSVLKKSQETHPECIVIAADTIVVAPDGKTILGKPINPKDAVRMVGLLSGKTHTVLTGYCILLSRLGKTPEFKSVVRVVKSQVKIRSLTPSSIRQYVATGEPLDKAGSYGAQGIGMGFIEQITGSYTNVVGLPIAQVLRDLEILSGVKLLGWLK